LEVLIVFHSQTGNTEKLAESCAKGASETEGVRTVLKRANLVSAEDIRRAKAIVICSPEYFGYMAGAIKDLFDRTFETLKDDPQVHKKPYAVIISAGNDGSQALLSIERIITGLKFKKVQNPVICKGRVTEEDLKKCYELGKTISEGLKLGIF